MHDIPENLHDIPDTLHDIPETLHDIPETLHDIPENLHDIPDTLHDIPETLHDIPDTLHDIPENLHDIAETLHDIPETLHDIPETLHDVIETMHDIEQALIFYMEYQKFSWIWLLCVTNECIRMSNCCLSFIILLFSDEFNLRTAPKLHLEAEKDFLKLKFHIKRFQALPCAGRHLLHGARDVMQ